MADPHHATEVLFGLNPMMTATAVLVLSYAFIISERIHRTVIALFGAGMLGILGVLSHELMVQGIDFNTIFLLTGMMIIVGIAKQSGMFQFVAIFAARTVKGNPRLLLAALAWVTALLSSLLDNVTTVLLVIPVTLLLTEQLKIKAYPFLFSQIFASNIGGTSTLIGDPPNIMIGSAVGLSFMDFVYNLAPVVIVIMIACTIIFDLIWGRKMTANTEDRAAVMKYNPFEAIESRELLVKSLAVLVLVIAGFIWGHGHGWAPGTVAMTGAALLMLLQCIRFKPEEQAHKVHNAFAEVEWPTIFFFIGLFVLVYGVEHTGLLGILANKMLALTGGDIPMTAMVILWSSAILSAIVDNIPFVATMIPLIKSMAPELGGAEAIMPLWWALALGACLGGNGSLIGASANVTVAGFAERAGQRISFMQFLKLAFPLMIFTNVIATIYVWMVYFS